MYVYTWVSQVVLVVKNLPASAYKHTYTCINIYIEKWQILISRQLPQTVTIENTNSQKPF